MEKGVSPVPVKFRSCTSLKCALLAIWIFLLPETLVAAEAAGPHTVMFDPADRERDGERPGASGDPR